MTSSATPQQKGIAVTNADRVVDMLKRAGVQRLFGMPGGGSNADVIEAAGRAGLPFSLAQTETGSAFMATAQAEITGKPGACIATVGPGAASVMNGVANANLDCVPLIVITDCQATSANEVVQHQTLRQGEMFAPLVKLTEKPSPEQAGAALDRVWEAALSLPPGPVHLDLSSEFTSAATVPENSRGKPAVQVDNVAAIRSDVPKILRASRRPVFLIGLGARSGPISTAIRTMCDRFGIPALVTYKAKGVVPDSYPWFAGVVTNGTLEREVLEQADAFIAVGLDPVELLPRPWQFPQPLVSLTAWPMHRRQIPSAIELVGDIASLLDQIGELLPKQTHWNSAEIQRSAEDQRGRMRPRGEGNGLRPHRVVELVAETYPGARATVDAGAFMFPVMSLWAAEQPCGMLISNGLATMGFALPAAIGASLLDKSKSTVAFTGDGGVLMCLGELLTAAREALPLRIVVFDDSELSLIKIKQVQRGYRTDSMSMGQVDWCSLGKGMGVLGVTADSEISLRDVLRQTLNHEGPVLIGARIDPSTYPDLIRALRG